MPLAHAPAARSGNENRHSFFKKQALVHLRAALLEDHANVEPRIPMARARARARGAAGRFWPN